MKQETAASTTAAAAAQETQGNFEPVSVGSLFSQEPSPEKKGKVSETIEAEKKAEETAAAGSEQKKEEGIKESEQKQAVNWDDDSNPYKQKVGEFERRYKDTQNWGFKLSDDLKRTQQKLQEYGLEDEISPQPTAEEIQMQVNRDITSFQERERASKAVAIEMYGADVIEKQLYAPDAPFRKIADNPAVIHAVKNADAPVLEAMRIVKSYEFFNKYGGDIEKIPSKIKAELEAELREKITKEMQGKITRKESLPNTLSKINSKDTSKEEVFEPTSLSQLFGQ